MIEKTAKDIFLFIKENYFKIDDENIIFKIKNKLSDVVLCSAIDKTIIEECLKIKENNLNGD
jgi:hypothetical protein